VAGVKRGRGRGNLGANIHWLHCSQESARGAGIAVNPCSPRASPPFGAVELFDQLNLRYGKQCSVPSSAPLNKTAIELVMSFFLAASGESSSARIA